MYNIYLKVSLASFPTCSIENTYTIGVGVALPLYNRFIEPTVSGSIISGTFGIFEKSKQDYFSLSKTKRNVEKLLFFGKFS